VVEWLVRLLRPVGFAPAWSGSTIHLFYLFSCYRLDRPLFVRRSLAQIYQAIPGGIGTRLQHFARHQGNPLETTSGRFCCSWKAWFVAILQLFGDAAFNGQFFNKLVVFDEAHKYIGNPDLVDGLASVVREMRHKGTSILDASQDPPSVPIFLIELSSQIILHRFNLPAWLKHIQKGERGLAQSHAGITGSPESGEQSHRPAFFREAVKLKLRPRATLHGDAAKTAV
jgi:hypothetical protein